MLVTCPGCLTDAERAQLGQREGASLFEVASGRRAEVAPERWLALDQVVVPLWVQERARELVT